MTQTDQAAYAAIYQYIGDQMRQGVADGTIYSALVSEGWDANIASQLVANMRAQQPAAALYTPQYQVPARPTQSYVTPRSSGGGGGAGNMALGGAICVIGIVITVGSYMAASSGKGSGGYVIAWGAIVFGAIRFFKGLAQMSGGE